MAATKNFALLMNSVKNHTVYLPNFGSITLQKILIIGAECTGKSTLSQALAKNFNTQYVPEYMRTYLDNKPADYVCQYDDLTPIAQGQMMEENRLLSSANRYLFCDTSLILLKVYSEFYFNQCPIFILENIPKLSYDKILLTDNIGIQWVADGQRDLPNGHDMIYDKIVENLKFYGLEYIKMSGNLDDRIQKFYDMINC